MTKLTELEIEFLKKINDSYNHYGKHGTDNTDFFNTFGVENTEYNKKMRAILTSMKRKKIVVHEGSPKDFCPIYPTSKFVEIMKELGEEVSEYTIKDAMKY